MDDDPSKLDAALYKIAEDHVEIPDACAWPPFLTKEGVPTNRTKRDSFRVLMRSELAEARNLHQSEPHINSAFPTLPAVDGYLENIAHAAENLANLLGPADWAPLAARNLDDPLLGPADWARSHALEQLRLHFMAQRSSPLEQLPLLFASERDGNSLNLCAIGPSELHHDNPSVAITKILATITLTYPYAKCTFAKP